jgi:hypothetical protein
MKEKRRHQRFSVDSMKIYGKILFLSDIRVLNISVGGAAFSIDRPINEGGVYILRLESKGRVLHLQGRIVWSKLNESIQEDGNIIRNYTIGMKFLNLSDSRRRDIEKFIKENFLDYQKVETFAPVMNGIRIHVRFHIRNPDKATVGCTEQYKVKRISQSGMLIESDNVLQIEDMVPMEMTLSEKKAIAFWGRIVTCKTIQNAEPIRYEIGIEFIDMSETDRIILTEFIHLLEDKK